MAFNINDIKGALTFGGARPTQFQVQITNPANTTGDLKLPFLVQAATIPPSTLGTIEVPYFGRKIKLAGDRVFDTWTVTVINDEDFLIRNALEEWHNRINSLEGNVRRFGTSAPAAYKSTALVWQYNKVGQRVREYELNGLFPVEISPIELDWNATDTIETYSVVFQYDWHVVKGGTTGLAGGSL